MQQYLLTVPIQLGCGVSLEDLELCPQFCRAFSTCRSTRGQTSIDQDIGTPHVGVGFSMFFNFPILPFYFISPPKNSSPSFFLAGLLRTSSPFVLAAIACPISH
ncbi:unnamed protein product [Fraxinus pennsylvanica]|uniref:Uncharacterized protein n=1 Tax=Fraxinus pennsylvanica TaxID=56036 RepID=A0AAD2DZV4_9LAMI|nr:unnamed protein product [Fraxinus pennsylvanica]